MVHRFHLKSSINVSKSSLSSLRRSLHSKNLDPACQRLERPAIPVTRVFLPLSHAPVRVHLAKLSCSPRVKRPRMEGCGWHDIPVQTCWTACSPRLSGDSTHCNQRSRVRAQVISSKGQPHSWSHKHS